MKVPTCLQCGTPATPGEGFCRHCGKSLLPPTIASPARPVVPPTYQPPLAASPPAPARKRRSPLLKGCLIFLVVLVVAALAGGIYIWRRSVYTPPERQAPQMPERAAGTLTEFPVDTNSSAPAGPTSVQTETLGEMAKSASASESQTKLPPGIDRTQLSKGATTMTSSTYRPPPTTTSTTSASSSTKDEIYICVLTAMPNQSGFADGLAASVTQSTGGQQKGIKVQSPKGATYTGSSIRSAQGIVYILNKQGGDIVILIYAPDPSMQEIAERLAQNVGNGEGLNDYEEVKNSYWTLPATAPSGLTLREITTQTRQQIESSIAGSSSGGGDEVERILSQMRTFIPERLTGVRYTDARAQEWVALEFEYASTFQAWRTWLLARGALGLSDSQSVTVREVDGLYLEQEGKRILIFQKGPYLVFLSSPSNASSDSLVALGNLFQI
jgi:hypothetical protein